MDEGTKPQVGRNLFTQIVLPFSVGLAAMAVFSVLITQFGLPDIPGQFFIFGALLEETIKFFLALGLIWLWVRPLNTALMGLGFGVGEQISHFWYPWGDASLITPWMHVTAALAVGWFLQKAFSREAGNQRTKLIIYAFLAGLTVHTLYNFVLWVMLLMIYW